MIESIIKVGVPLLVYILKKLNKIDMFREAYEVNVKKSQGSDVVVITDDDEANVDSELGL